MYSMPLATSSSLDGTGAADHVLGRDRRDRPRTRHGRGVRGTVDHEVIWSRADKGRFPDIKELKQLVRDRIAPEMDLGHTDRGP